MQEIRLGLKKQIKDSVKLGTYLEQVMLDVLYNLDAFRTPESDADEELRVDELANVLSRYRVNLLEGGEEREVTLEGDLWQLDARLLGWKGLAALIGLQPGYRLEKLSGRFLAIEQQQSARFARVALAESPYGIDLWRWLRAGQHDLFLLDAQARRVTYLPMADGAVYSVSLTPAGLLAQPMTQAADQALKDWQ